MAGPYAYECNQGSNDVYVIDTSDNTVVGSPIGVGTQPSAICATPDGQYVFVSNVGGDTVSVIQTSDNTVIASISGFTDPYGLVATPDSSLVYVCNLTGDSVVMIDVGTLSIVGSPIGVGSNPVFICISPDGSTVYVSNQSDDTVSVIQTSDNTVIDTISGLPTPLGVACSPDGSLLYVACNRGNEIGIIDTSTNLVIGTVSLSGEPFKIAFSPDGSTAYATLQGASQMAVIDVGSSTETTSFGTNSGPQGVVVTPSNDAVLCSTTSEFIDSFVIPGYSADAIGCGTSPQDICMVPTPVVPVDLAGTADIEYDAEGDIFVTPDAADLSGTADIQFDATADISLGIPLEGTSDIEYNATGDLFVGTPIDLEGTADIEYNATGDIEVHFLEPVHVTSFVLAGDPGPLGVSCFLALTPPNPQPGPFGNHDYEVVVCDAFGIAYGVIPTAVPTEIDYELDDIGQALIDFYVLDPQAAYLLPMDAIPGVREIQIWRDQELIWWGWPTSATWDQSQVHLTCSGLLWPLGQRLLGPGFRHFLVNPQFEEGLTGWEAVDCTAVDQTACVALGEFAARLVQPDTLQDSYLHQVVTIDLTDSPTGLGFSLSAWAYLDTGYAYTGPALNQRGLWISDNFGNISFCEMDNTFPQNTWTRLEVQPTDPNPCVIALPGVVTVFDIRLYCPGGSVVWDAVNFDVYENVSSPPPSPPATSWDVASIVETLLITAQQNIWTKSPLQYQFYGSPTGVFLNRVYLVETNEVYLDAFNEFPTIGVADFEMVWDETGHFRGLELFYPAKGAIKYNAVLNPDVNTVTQMQGSIDGASMGTTQRVLGQGSTGPSEDTGYAAFASFLGGRTADDGSMTIGTNTVTSTDIGFTDADVGSLIYSLDGGFLPGTYITEVSGDTATLSELVQLTLLGETIGVGGITLDVSTAALPDQPISTLQSTARAYLIQSMKPLAMPANRQRADGPNGLFGLVTVGDVVFASSSYGWVNFDPVMARISKIVLYPPTEEMEIDLMPVGALPSLT